jgi:hypothetical protein
VTTTPPPPPPRDDGERSTTVAEWIRPDTGKPYHLPRRCRKCNSRDIMADDTTREGGEWIMERCYECGWNQQIKMRRR